MRPDTESVDVSRLPPTFRRLIKSMGLPAALTLLQARGGTRFYFGGQRGRSDRQLLKDIVGGEAAEAFYGEFATGKRLRGGHISELTLPKVDKLMLTVRDAEICRSERSLMELALMYRLTSRQVQNIRRRGVQLVRRHPSQLALFPHPEAAASDERGRGAV